MRGITVDGNEVAAVYDAIAEAAADCRAGRGPVLVECQTYRWRGHSKSDRQLYRTREELAEWQGRDPIPRYAKELGWSDAQVEEARAEANKRIDAAVAFAEASPEPDVKDVMEGVYA